MGSCLAQGSGSKHFEVCLSVIEEETGDGELSALPRRGRKAVVVVVKKEEEVIECSDSTRRMLSVRVVDWRNNVHFGLMGKSVAKISEF